MRHQPRRKGDRVVWTYLAHRADFLCFTICASARESSRG